jgi:anti-anti-sigma factor
MDNFLSRNENGVVVETVNLIKATSEEAIFIDSTFLSALIVAQKVAMEDGGKLILLSPQNEVAEVLEATGMTKIFKIYSSVEEALPSFNSDEPKSAVG